MMLLYYIKFCLGLGQFLKMELIKTLKKTFFTIVIDETTDITVKSQLAIMVQYWSFEKDKEMVDFLCLLECADASADGLASALIFILESYEIPLNRYFFLVL